MIANFTAGPWRFVGDTDTNGCAVVTNNSPDGWHWDIAYCQPDPDANTAKSNAHLVAAAPELYEACMRMIGSLGCMIGDPDNCGDIIFARAATAKARGEQ